MQKILLAPLALLILLFGRFSWQAPAWLQRLFNLIKNHLKATAVFITLLAFLVVAYFFYQAQPKPIVVKADITPLAITPNYADAKPDNLIIGFSYDIKKLHRDQTQPEGLPSVARIDLLGNTITDLIHFSPAKKGRWTWIDDRQLQFIPETDWPAGTQYKLVFERALFSDDTKLSDYRYEFFTPALTAEFSEIEFYQDPTDISIRRVVATLQFSHPVDKTSLEKNLSMAMGPSGENSSLKAASFSFEPFLFKVSYDKQFREAYIQSAPVQLPEQPNYMKVALDKGLESVLGGAKSGQSIDKKILIPDLFSFLKVEQASVSIVRDEKNNPQQVLAIEFTDDIDQAELLSKLSIFLLPKAKQRNGKHYWGGPREVSSNVLQDSQKLNPHLIANPRNEAKMYSFVLDVPDNRYLYIKIDKGLRSVNQFVHLSFYDTVVQAPRYPQEVDIAGDGSVLSYSGTHQLSVLSRGLGALQYSVGRVMESQLYHLISQSRGDINNPEFNSWSFGAENISSFETNIVDLQTTQTNEANYSSIDLSRYLSKSDNQFGLFFVRVKGWDRAEDREIYNAKDERLVLITDLGLIVKNNADSSHELFVQSISSGNPVQDARVELLGKNGAVLFGATTGTDGHARIPSTQGLTQAQQPTVYVIKTHNDLSFIPFDRRSRQINLSRFDIGGVSSKYINKESLNAFVFSDRGIYRPGETVNIAMAVKNFDFSNIENIPLELVVRNSRNSEVKVSKFTLPKMGFTDFQFVTTASSATGGYNASLHLLRDKKHRGQVIGNVNFKVEEFQPDTIKIESQIIAAVDKGWNRKDSLQLKVKLNNLFGTAAQDRKVTARVNIKPKQFAFSQYKDYQFTNPFANNDSDKKPLSLNQNLEKQLTDADGIAEFILDLQKFREGTYQLDITAEGFDQAGGRSVIASNSALISPLPMLVGYKADGKLDYINADSKRTLEFIAIDNGLNSIKGEKLTLRLFENQAISTLVKQNNGTYQYQTVAKKVELSSNDLEIEANGFDYEINTSTPGDFTLEVSDAEGLNLSSLNYSVVGFANLSGKIDKNAELQVKLNKQDYLPGEIIELSIKAPYSGAGLISIESDKVHQFKWFKTTEESTVQQIRLPEHLEGTAYINVSFVRDVASKEIFTSPLSYAVAPFSIDKSRRRIDVTLRTDAIVRPGKPMTISFSTSKPARIAVFAVDEGVLQVANYKTPDPLGHFLKKRALDVETLQILDLILPDFNLFKSLSASGGGARARSKALAQNLNPFVRKTDKQAVYWSGIYDADTDLRSVNFAVPNTFAGELRVMAVAVGESSVGASHSSALVRGPFVISPNVLTQAAPGDEFLVTVGVANIIKGSGKNAPVDLSVNASKQLSIIGDSATQLLIDEGGEAKFSVRVKANPVLGAAELSFTAKHNDDELTRTTSLSIRPATNYLSSIESGFSNSGKVQLTSQRNLYSDLAEQSLTASASPLVLVDGLTDYLKTFPHGCTEQVVSKVFPLVGLSAHPAYAAHTPKVKKQFLYLIDQLRTRQQADGGFAFWPGHTRSAGYPSIYVMHFLLEANELGFPVPADMLQRGKNYLRDYAERSTNSLAAARDRATAIYLLTRMGEVTSNYLIDLEESLQAGGNKAWQEDILSAYMAASYQLLQKDQQAAQLISGFKIEAGLTENLQTKRHGRIAPPNVFYSELAIDAQYVYLLAKHFKSKAKALDTDALHQLTDKIYRGEYNTISSVYTILALGAYSELVLENDFNETIEFSAYDSNDKRQLLTASLAPFLTANYANDAKRLAIKSAEPLFYLNSQAGFDKELPNAASAEGIEIFRSFIDTDAEAGIDGDGDTNIDGSSEALSSYEQGKELTVVLKVRALDGKSLSNIAVVDLLPGGFEVIRSSLNRAQTYRGVNHWQADYVDIREDRVVFYGSFDNKVRELRYKVKLTAAGDFVIPPSYAESMYDRKIRANSKAGRFTVTAAQ